MKLNIADQRTRAYVYRGLVGSAPLLVAYGLLSAEEVALWLAAAAAWLGLGLAARNTSTKR